MEQDTKLILELPKANSSDLWNYEENKQFWDELEELWIKDSVERIYRDAANANLPKE